jgi:hypothetical protein
MLLFRLASAGLALLLGAQSIGMLRREAEGDEPPHNHAELPAQLIQGQTVAAVLGKTETVRIIPRPQVVSPARQPHRGFVASTRLPV